MKAFRTAEGITCDSCSTQGTEVEILPEYNEHCCKCGILLNTETVIVRKTLSDYPNA